MTPENYSRCESGQRTMSITTEKVYRANVYLMSFLNDLHIRDAVTRNHREDEKVSPEKAKKALSAFQKIFLEMKINPVYDATEKLTFVFSRGPRPDEDEQRGEDDPEWISEPPEQKVA
jgi:hypothetical protein